MSEATEKQLLREEMIARRKAMSGEARAAADAEILRRLLADPAFEEAEQIFAYVSMPHEVDTKVLIAACLEKGKVLGLPICGEKGQMAFYRLKSQDELKPGKYRIPVPPIARDRRMIADRHTLVIVPMLAFDASGFRLGAGGGFYDRWLMQHLVPTVGICYENGRVQLLPHEKHDQRIDRVITEGNMEAPNVEVEEESQSE